MGKFAKDLIASLGQAAAHARGLARCEGCA